MINHEGKHMWNALTVLISRFFNRQRHLDELCNALAKYKNDSQNPAAQFKLETAFFKAYKKEASAKFIALLADSDWGPREAFMVFGRSSPAVMCDFQTHNIVLGRRWFNRSALTRALISSVFGALALACGVGAVFVGILLIYLAVIQVELAGGVDILKESIELGFNVFLLGAIAISAAWCGGLLVYVGWNTVGVLEAENKAEKLNQLLNPNEEQTPSSS